MKPIIETSRLVLRAFTVEDAEAFYQLNTDPEVLKYTGDLPFASVEEARTFLEHYSEYKKHGFGRWAVLTKMDQRVIGWCGLKYNEEGQIDIGFRFFRNQWGKGYATEAAQATLHYGFTHLHLTEVVGRAIVENKSSVRVLEKLGMQFWKYGTCHGLENAVYYKITADSFQANSSASN